MEKESYIRFSKDHQRNPTELKRIIKMLLGINLILIIFFIFSVISVCYMQFRVNTLQKHFEIFLVNEAQVNAVSLENLQKFQDEHLKLLEDYIKVMKSTILPPDNENENENYAENDYQSTTDYENEGSENGEKDDENYDYNIFESDGKKLKSKREIRDYDLSSEKDLKSIVKSNTDKPIKITKNFAEKDKSWTEVFGEVASNEKFLPSSYKITFGSTRKPHLRKKHRKSRIGSAEKFYMEYQSTTTTPIQVRRSRTKSTESEDIDKTVSLNNEKFQQHTSPRKDTITKEEAFYRNHGRRNSEETTHYVDTFRENSRERFFDAPTYNMITIHFSADTSHYSKERDPHYFGNGRMQIKSDVYKDWKPAHWTQGVGMSKYFNLHQGRVTVSTTGIYLIYAQIQYSNVQEVNGFSVFRNNEVVVQCITTSTHPDKHEIKSNTCGISTTILLQSNDSVCIKDLHHGRYVVLTPEKSYFGLVLLSPFKN